MRKMSLRRTILESNCTLVKFKTLFLFLFGRKKNSRTQITLLSWSKKEFGFLTAIVNFNENISKCQKATNKKRSLYKVNTKYNCHSLSFAFFFLRYKIDQTAFNLSKQLSGKGYMRQEKYSTELQLFHNFFRVVIYLKS